MAHRRNRGIALLFLDHGTRRGWRVSVMPQLLFTPRKDPVPIVQEAGWAPGLVWTGAENLAPTGIRSPDRPAHSQSLFRLCYSAHILFKEVSENKQEANFILTLVYTWHMGSSRWYISDLHLVTIWMYVVVSLPRIGQVAASSQQKECTRNSTVM